MKTIISHTARKFVFASAVLFLLVLPAIPAQAADYLGKEYVGTSYYAPSSYTGTSYYSPSNYVGTSYYDNYDYVGTSYYYPTYDYVGTSYYDDYDYVGTSYYYDDYDYVGTSYYDYPDYDYVGTSYYDTYTPSYSSSYSSAYASAYASSYASSYSFPSSNKKVVIKDDKDKKKRPTCDMWVSDSHIDEGERVVLHWESSHADDVFINNGVGSVSRDGSKTVRPSRTTTYTGTFEGDGGTVKCSATVFIDKDKDRDRDFSECEMWFTDSRIERGEKTTLKWDSENVDDVYINNGIGDVGRSGSRSVRPDSTTTYTGTFEGDNGRDIKCYATVYVERDVYVPPIYQTPYVMLSQVPYTGLDLGPVGTAVYYSFLVLWAAFAAYLIAVKRLHVDVYRALKRMLFGEDEEVTQQPVSQRSSDLAAYGVARPFAHQAPAPHNAAEGPDGIDPFIALQINRNF